MEFINTYLCGVILPCALMVFGLFFAIKYKFFYILHPVRLLKSSLKNRGGLRALSVALAGTLGVGNIIGVASAIQMGGAGSIFWMWVSALFAMSLKYAEVCLAMRFRRRKGGEIRGGAPYYINEGLKGKIGIKPAYFLSCIFAIFCVVNSLTTGNLVQINSVSTLLPLPPLAFGIIFTVLAFVVIIGGLKRIGKITSILIPVLTFGYVSICIIALILNFDMLPRAFKMIFNEAFSFKSAVCGFCGYGFFAAMRYGVSRGVLSNEAGCGTSPSAHATNNEGEMHPQGCLGIFEVLVDTLLLCTLTALVILTSNVYQAKSAVDLILSAFENILGTFGAALVLTLCVLFAFATVICQFFYGIEALGYIWQSSRPRYIFTFIFCFVLLVGSVIPMALMWQISDLALAFMTIFNLIALFLLRRNI